MKFGALRILAVLVSGIVAVGLVLASLVQAESPKIRARAIVQGPGGISGVVTFTEQRSRFPLPPTDGAGVRVEARISGPPGALTPGRHGFHIHEVANCAPFTAAGGHFDPGPNGNSNPDTNHPFHMGDLPNLEVNADGEGRLKHRTSRITLSPGPISVFDANGSAIIVHLNRDQGITGPAGSGVSGGPRIACGIIEMVSGDDDDDDRR